MATILVTGGTGKLGREVITHAAQAHHVKLLSRGPEPEGVRDFGWATGDLLSGNGVYQSLEGVDTVIHCATSNGAKDVQAAENLLSAARSAGTAHLIYVSIVGVDRIPLPYYRAKNQVENLFTESGLGISIQRATQFHDLIAGLVRMESRLPLIPVLQQTLFQPVSTSDVATRLLDLAVSTPQGRVDDFGGPEVLPMRLLAAKTLEALGKRRTVIEVEVPGAIANGYAAGYHLAPEHRDGTITFDDYLATHFASA